MTSGPDVETITFDELAGHLSSAIGGERATKLIREAALSQGLKGEAVTRLQALALLDRLAEAEGIVGITARFAKSRLHLQWNMKRGRGSVW